MTLSLMVDCPNCLGAWPLPTMPKVFWVLECPGCHALIQITKIESEDGKIKMYAKKCDVPDEYLARIPQDVINKENDRDDLS